MPLASISFKASAMLDITSIHPICTTIAATFHLTRLYAIELCFLFNVDSNFELLSTTLIFSFKTLVYPSIGIPKVLNLNLRLIIYSTYVFIAMKLLEKVLDSTVVCLLLYQLIGLRWENMMYPVCDRLVFLSAALDA